MLERIACLKQTGKIRLGYLILPHLAGSTRSDMGHPFMWRTERKSDQGHPPCLKQTGKIRLGYLILPHLAGSTRSDMGHPFMWRTERESDQGHPPCTRVPRSSGAQLTLRGLTSTSGQSDQSTLIFSASSMTRLYGANDRSFSPRWGRSGDCFPPTSGAENALRYGAPLSVADGNRKIRCGPPARQPIERRRLGLGT
jgi:hypothetical protein